MIKKTSKITMMASLVVATMVNAQEFYTCVPKKSWWIGMMREGTAKWKKVLYLQITSPLDKFKGVLQPGTYRVSGSAAGGEEIIKEFTLTKTSEYIACVGASGGGAGGNAGVSGGGGGGGGGKGGYGGGGGGGAGGYLGNSGGSGGSNSNGSGGNGTAAESGMSGGDGQNNCYSNCGRYSSEYGNFASEGRGGSGCAGGGGSNVGNGGGGGGSYFSVADVELILKGGDGKPGIRVGDLLNGGDGAGPDGYVIVERLE